MIRSILRCDASQHNNAKLYQALLEIGRAVHTIYVARYLEDSDLRREIHRNLCRGEAWNAMTRIIFSFNRAIMACAFIVMLDTVKNR